MAIRKNTLIATLALAILLPLAAEGQPGPGAGPGPGMGPCANWPGGGPGPYSPFAAGRYGAGNPYARDLNALAVKDPAKHDACFTQANEKNLRRDARWKFMIDCMKK